MSSMMGGDGREKKKRWSHPGASNDVNVSRGSGGGEGTNLNEKGGEGVTKEEERFDCFMVRGIVKG